MKPASLLRMWPYAMTIAALYVLWKVAAWTVSSAVLPQPETAAIAFFRALAGPDFWLHFLASGRRAVAAMSLAWAVGFPLGVAMGGFKLLDKALSPLVFLTYPIPKIVLLPVAFILLGLGDAAKIAMIAIILGYQVLVTTRDGVMGIPRQYVDSVRSLGAKKRQVLREVLWPAALPHGFTALRLNAGVSVAILFFVESFATRRGLGHLIVDAWGMLDYETMFVGIFGMSLLGVLLYESVNSLEKRVCNWRRC